MERKQSQKEEEEMMKQIQATVTEGKGKIEERFAELTKELTEGLEREKGRMEAQYVSKSSVNVNWWLISFFSP